MTREEKQKAAKRKWLAANKDRHRANADRWRKDNPINAMLISARYRSKQLNVPFDLETTDLEMPKVCPYLKIPLDSSDREHTPTLDRIIPKLGYVKGNVRICSFRANRIKSDATADELRMIADVLTLSLPTLTL